MSAKTHNIGIIGCGDFLRRRTSAIKASAKITVRWLFDPARERAAKYAADFGGKAADSAEAIFGDPEVHTVYLFVPPWLRRAMVEKAAAAGKHIMAAKPIAASIEDADAIVAATSRVRCGVLYSRSGDDFARLARKVLASGEIGRLVLYRQDWLHHYPQWNTWALDPVKNGGPFMDAMVHNLNMARYLMGRPMTAATFFSDKLAHPDLPCADTQSMKIDFAGGGCAYLFITWAADLAVYSADINDREHIDLFYMVSEKGWRLTRESSKDGSVLVASRAGQTKTWVAKPFGGTVFDRFAEAVESGAPLPEDIVEPLMAAEDIRLVRNGEKHTGELVRV
jgi:predicted dehydrogenase